jgi:hypothetical protein
MFTGMSEKTFSDKMIARSDIDKLEQLCKKETWNESDLNDVLYLLGGAESKLLNFDENERMILAKYFVWIDETLQAHMTGLNYQKYVVELEKKEEKIIRDSTDKHKKEYVPNYERTKILNYCIQKLNHYSRFFVYVWLFLSRSTLSVRGGAFNTLSKQIVEMQYRPNSSPISTEKKSFGGFSW